MRTLLASAATAAILATGAIAQDQATGTYEMSETDYFASDILGSRIYGVEGDVNVDTQLADINADWDDIGEINDVIMTEDGQIGAVVVGVGGFLGIGEKDVALQWDSIQTYTDEGGNRFLAVSATQESLESAPAFEYDAMQNDVAAGGANATEGAAATDMATAEGEAAATEETMAEGEAPEVDAEPVDEAAAEGEAAATEETVVEEGDTRTVEAEIVEETEAEGDTAAAEGDAAMTEEPVAEGDTAAAEGDAATTEQPAAEGEVVTTEPVDPAATTPVATDDAMATDGTAMAPEGFTMVPVSELTADELTGTTVYSTVNGERVADIGELVLNDEGQITQAVVDIGGFLGIGARQVAMSFDDLTIMREDGTGGLRVEIDATQEQLEGMEEYVAPN